MRANVFDPASSSSSPPSSQLSPSSRTLLSRLTALSPLRSRTRNLVDFHIRPLEPYRKYSPGDLVRGAVVLTVVKPIRITHLTVALHGFIRVWKHANGPTESNAADVGLRPLGSSQKAQLVGNGHASLFQDEVTLCGEGRLDMGVYEFNFELEFPKTGLPTSIDFERGTISYLIRATITRPTTISATSTCDRKVSLVETVDIGPLRPLKPRTISLEPISRRHKLKRRSSKATAVPSSHSTPEDSSSIDGSHVPSSPHPDDSASQAGSATRSVMSHTAPNSPIASEIQSEVGGESVVSSESTGRSIRIGPTPSFRSGPGSYGTGTCSKASLSEKTITATIEMLKPGCLPGDTLQVRISIQHTKCIRSMHGIIVTLYRQSRIDSHPPLSMFVDVKGKAAERLKHEEYYPKSKTGLGGLSLSSAGSSSVFRKDLSQTFAPLLIDPTTLSTTVTASIRVPADCFPTINNAPGQMISFKYYIEVVLDLGGKLASQQSFLPRIGMVSLPSTNYGGSGTQSIGHQDDRLPNMLSSWNGNIVDTDHIRREKSVVTSVLEVIVGTTDSARVRGRGATGGDTGLRSLSSGPAALGGNDGELTRHNDALGTYQPTAPDYDDLERQVEDSGIHENEPAYDQSHFHDTYNHNSASYTEHEQIPMYVPRPEVPAEQNLSDKERVIQAEQRLLPSQPPQEDAGPSMTSGDTAPSAPMDLGDLYGASDAGASSADPSAPGPSTPFVPPATSEDPLEVPAHEQQDNPNAADDKRELERQRLLAEASAPPDFPDDDEEPHVSEPLPPTAPTLNEDEAYEDPHSHHTSEHHDELPAYQNAPAYTR